ncbi:MAG: 8-oxoguanine deaminase [Planktomarina sp.]
MKQLIKNAQTVLTMQDNATDLSNVDILIENGWITQVAANIDAPDAEVTHAKGCVVTPGLVNTHHHLYQTMTRAVPAAQDAALFGWLQALYPIWGHMRPDDFVVSAQVGLAELLLSGCTLTSDHLYLYPNGTRMEDTIEAAQSLGIRFHPTRGAMSIGESDGGLPPDALVEHEPAILEDMIRVIDGFHDPAAGSMCRVGLAPCSPFSVTRELMRDAAVLARDKGVMLHTHLAENDEDIAYSLEKFGVRPGEYAEQLGWVGDDVWHAHCVKLDEAEIDLFARTKTGVAHCPCSNCRLASGIAPVVAMTNAGVPVGLGVDGSASNDTSDIMSEARQVLLLQRVAYGPDAMSSRKALRIATRGGAEVLGRHDCGQIAKGFCGDIAIWDVGDLKSAGSWDPAALLLAGPTAPRDVFVHGRKVVDQGQLVPMDARALAAKQNAHLARLMDRV